MTKIAKDEVATSVRQALATFRNEVLDKSRWIKKKGILQYPFNISEGEVLRRAGIQSRSTLMASYHQDLRVELRNAIEDLKVAAGKRTVDKRDNTSPDGRRTIKLEEIIAAQDLRIAQLEAQLATMQNVIKVK